MERLTRIREDGVAWYNHTPDHSVSNDELLEKLAAYEAAEAEGRLIVLPCKVDDPYFTIERICNCGGDEEIWTHHWGSDCEYCFHPCNAKKTVVEHRFANKQQIMGYSNSIGKSVFLTREDAWAALRGGVSQCQTTK